jgi:hypothetical protein
MHVRIAKKGLDVVDLPEMVGEVPIMEGDEVCESEVHAAVKGQIHLELQIFVRKVKNEGTESGGLGHRCFAASLEGLELFGLSAKLNVVVAARRLSFLQDLAIKHGNEGALLQLVECASAGRPWLPIPLIFGKGFDGTQKVVKCLMSHTDDLILVS